jgi:lipid-A-disaccharide synthase
MPADRPRIFLVAGEPSGDALAAPLIAALRSELGPDLEIAGIGGARMQAEGLVSLFPMQELSLMGLVEVLPHLPRLWRRLRQTEAAIRASRPDAVVTVDAPGFNFRLAARLRGSGIPIVHYVAPTVWAWRPARARRIAPLFRHLLALLPFEPPYFIRWGLATTYVGHPVLDTVAAFRAKAGAQAAPPVSAAATGAPRICLLPGSRRGELRRLLPVYEEALRILRRRFAGLTVTLPTVPHLAQLARNETQAWETPPEIIVDRQAGLAAMASADMALAASGTVTLELALLGTPMVAAYRANPLTVAIVRRLLLVSHVTLVNIILGRAAIPELLQERCTPDALAAELERLLTSADAVTAQRAAYAELAQRLAVDQPPSERAAAIVADIVRERMAGS